jgi:nucleoside-diphosphate-sugar epimerase
VNGLNKFGYELAKSLSEQGGYVIIVDNLDKEHDFPEFSGLKNTAFLDFVGVADMVEEIRRLDYVFYLNHTAFADDSQFTSQEFLAASSYLNQILNLSAEFEALFLLTNSIRAHKYLLSIDRYSQRFLEDNPKDSVSYSEAEFVRYSESLVLEYKNTRGLKAKILRVGELLGEGIELDKKTYIGRMIWQAINSENLILEKDGLDSEYYVHLLDGVYGVLKAQFGKDIQDTIFTLAYSDPLTQLSLAYKLQEFEPEAGDIKFSDEDDGKVRLNLPIYKAAQNLQKIGWQPKVDLDAAIIQSIAYAKQLTEKYQISDEEATVSAKEKEEIAIGGPLSRLIAERKQNEEQNKKKLSEGVSEMELRKRNIPRSVQLRRSLTKRYDKFKKNFEFLREITIMEAGLYTVLISLFMFIFLTLFSPLVTIIRDFVLLDRNITEAVDYAEASDWENFSEASANASDNISSLDETISNADVLFFLTGREGFREELLGLVQSIEFLVDGMNSFSESVLLSEQVYENADAELVFRPTNASVLAVNQNADEQTTAVDLSVATSQNDIARRAIENADSIYSQLNRSIFPNFIVTYSDNLFSYQDDFDDLVENNAKTLVYAERLQQQNYRVGFVVQDNLRPTYNGGEITSVGLLEYSNGELQAVRLLPLTNVDFSINELSEEEVSAIQEVARNRLVINDSNNATADILPYIIETETYNQILQQSFSETFSVPVDEVISLNMNSFSDLFSRYGSFEINGEQFNSDNYIQQLNVLQDNSITSREILVTNVSALLTTRFFEPNADVSDRIQVVRDTYNANDLIVDQSILTDLGIEESQPNIYIAGLSEESERFDISPQVDINLVGNISRNIINYEVTINSNNAPEVDEVAFCIDRSSTDFVTDNLPLESFARANLSQFDCLLLDMATRNQYSFAYNKAFTGELLDVSIANAPGLAVRYDVEMIYPTSYLLAESVPIANQRANSVFYSGETYNGFDFSLQFN